MGMLDEAIDTYKQGLTHDPNNAGLAKGLKDAEERKSAPGGGGAGGKSPQMNQAYIQAMMKLLSNPETKDYIGDPEFMKKVQMIMENPAAFQFLSSDPKIKKAFEVISSDIPTDFDFEGLMKGAQGKSKEDPFKMDEEHPQPKYEQPNYEQPNYEQPKYEQPKPEPKKEEPKVEDPAENMKNQGNIEFKKKNFAAAVDLYEQAIQMKPD